jgi:large conductance mechanosensitive channel
MLDEFKRFLFRGNVIDLAVAVIIGAAFTAIVAAITTGLITPLIGMLFSKDFTEMTFEVNGSEFNYGIVIDAVIRFVSTAAVVFFFIVKPVQAIMARRAAGEEPEEEAAAPSDEAVLLAEIRDLLTIQRRP